MPDDFAPLPPGSIDDVLNPPLVLVQSLVALERMRSSHST
jgi:hypothetical protein